MPLLSIAGGAILLLQSRLGLLLIIRVDGDSSPNVHGSSRIALQSIFRVITGGLREKLLSLFIIYIHGQSFLNCGSDWNVLYSCWIR
jgi:hypothetical protein